MLKIWNLIRRIALLLLLTMLTSCGITPGEPAEPSPLATSVIRKNVNAMPVIRLASGEWIPYTGENLPGYGCDSRIITEVFNQMGYSIEYGFFPWARAMHFAETGEWDGTVDWGDTPEFREKFYINADPISDQEMVFFYRKGQSLKWNTLDDLEGKAIGITTGYVYDNVFKTQIEKVNLTFIEASSDAANFKKLLAGRIDIFPIERNVGLALLRSQFSPEERDQLQYDTKLLTTFHPHLLLSKAVPRNEELIKKFDDYFARMRQTPAYLTIINDCVQ